MYIRKEAFRPFSLPPLDLEAPHEKARGQIVVIRFISPVRLRPVFDNIMLDW